MDIKNPRRGICKSVGSRTWNVKNHSDRSLSRRERRSTYVCHQINFQASIDHDDYFRCSVYFVSDALDFGERISDTKMFKFSGIFMISRISLKIVKPKNCQASLDYYFHFTIIIFIIPFILHLDTLNLGQRVSQSDTKSFKFFETSIAPRASLKFFKCQPTTIIFVVPFVLCLDAWTLINVSQVRSSLNSPGLSSHYQC